MLSPPQKKGSIEILNSCEGEGKQVYVCPFVHDLQEYRFLAGSSSAGNRRRCSDLKMHIWTLSKREDAYFGLLKIKKDISRDC